MSIFQKAAKAPPFSRVLADWWKWYKGDADLADTTIHKKEWEMQTYILPAFGETPTPEISEKNVEDYRDVLLECLSPAMVIGLFHILRPAFRWAAEKGIIPENPVKGVKMPKIPYREIEIFTPDEIKKLVACARPIWFRNLILLAYQTGMRRGELYGLKWEDVDFADDFLTVRRSVEAFQPKQRLIHPPKTRASRRRIMLDKASLAMLAARKYDAKTEWIFESRTGAELSPWNCTRYMHSSCVLAGIRPRCFHTLRHSHATLLLSKGINPKIVQERLGHARITTTLETYSHVLPTMQGIVVDVLDKIEGDE